jgi:hypothetical protein
VQGLIVKVVAFAISTFQAQPVADLKAMEARANHLEALLCVTDHALDMAEFTQESAEVVAKYAVRSCAKEMFATSANDSEALALMESVQDSFALDVVNWRVEAGKSGSFAVVRKRILGP